ncbi:MAG: ABC transporter permease [Lachnospiraceae bacterium]|nr:ABC transporter permease [Lachnospiraceae bacterium]
MNNTIKQLSRSPKFMTGFCMFVAIILFTLIYPLVNPGNPLEMIGVGTFARPGTYVSLYDAVSAQRETFKLADADDKRLAASISDEDRVAMIELFGMAGMELDIEAGDTEALLEAWEANFDTLIQTKMTSAKRKYYTRINNKLLDLKAADTLVVYEQGEEDSKSKIVKTDYVRTGAVANVKTLPLGTDNFGRDVLKELVSAAKTSLMIGLIAGTVATLVGLTLGLLSGYLGGNVDEIIMFITTMFTVIPSFVLLILISYSLGQEQRGPSVVAIVIGLTSWTWTCRSVRSQVISLRNRDHVNLSKLSGHSLGRIIVTDILPYIASYVVMAFILQVSSGILAEAQLSLLGLGPKTTTTPTLGLMMNWAMLYSAHTNGSWWAYFPVILTIACISFSLNLMNTGMDQVFNPALRDG